MTRRHYLAALPALVVGALLADPASAITIGFQPSVTNVSSGQMFSVDVVISGVAAASQVVSAFDLDVAFDATILFPRSVSFSTLLGDSSLFEALTSFDLTVPGVFNFAAVSLLFDFELAVLQPDSFTLATLHFSALQPGSSLLSFAQGADDIKGVFDINDIPTILPIAVVETGTVNVAPAVPEPSTWILLVFGSASAVRIARRRQERM